MSVINGMEMKFELGMTVQTRGLYEKCNEDSKFASEVKTAFLKYVKGDWGDTCKEDWDMNDRAVESGEDRIFAAYNTSLGKIYIITEWDRSATTVLFAREY